jgi:hypothetical protein
VFAAFFQTLIAVLFRPRATFEQMRVSSGIGSAYVFYLVPNAIALAISTAIQGFVMSFIASILPPGSASPQGGTNLAFSGVMIVAMPFVAAGLTHLLLVVANGQKHGYGATFRVGAYASGSVALFSWIPCIGWLGAPIWSLVVSIIGLAGIHETSRGKAAFAVIVTVVIVIAVAVVGWFAAIAMGLIEAPTPPTQV